MRKSGNTIAIQAMRHGRKKDVREFEKPNCDARGAAIALINKAFNLLAITSLYITRTYVLYICTIQNLGF